MKVGRKSRVERRGLARHSLAEVHGARCPTRAAARAFTLLEVFIATALFFMAVFAVLSLVGTALRSARVLQQKEPDVGMLMMDLMLTNRLYEGTESGDFEEIAPGAFRGYSWRRDITQVATNGLFKVEFLISRNVGQRPVESRMDILLYRPESPPGSAFQR